MKVRLKVLDLFSGIGGFSLGLERAGMETIAFCENDKACQKVLSKHWPQVPIFGDIRRLRFEDGQLIFTPKGNTRVEALKTEIDVICGGFPCQDISVGGRGEGIDGERSGLWKEYKRIINEVRPKYAVIENVERLRKKGLGIVLSDLHEIGFDAEWHCITAESVGLPHQRDRLWIIAYNRGLGQHERVVTERRIQANEEWESEALHQQRERCQLELGQVRTLLSGGAIKRLKDAYADKFSSVLQVRRVVDGISPELDKVREVEIKQLGNSVVPQIPEVIGRALILHSQGL